jgi:hypothetical protein
MGLYSREENKEQRRSSAKINLNSWLFGGADYVLFLLQHLMLENAAGKSITEIYISVALVRYNIRPGIP